MHYGLTGHHEIYSWLLPDQPMSDTNIVYTTHVWSLRQEQK